MTKRRVERLLEQAKENGHGDDGGDEIAVELAGVPARGPDEDDPPPARDDRPAFEAFRVNLETGEVETPETPDPDDLPECATCGLNPAHPRLNGECEACAGMPSRDWRPVVHENERGEDHE